MIHTPPDGSTIVFPDHETIMLPTNGVCGREKHKKLFLYKTTFYLNYLKRIFDDGIKPVSFTSSDKAKIKSDMTQSFQVEGP